MLISMSAKKVQPAIAQLEERRFVIGNRSKTTLGPVFESRWLDIFTTSHFFFFFFAPYSHAPSPAGMKAILGSWFLAEAMKPWGYTTRPI